jgi:hypothetical protein
MIVAKVAKSFNLLKYTSFDQLKFENVVKFVAVDSRQDVILSFSKNVKINFLPSLLLVLVDGRARRECHGGLVLAVKGVLIYQ